MKKYARIIALILALATCACLLASCGGMTGNYGTEEKYDYKYTTTGANGKKVEVIETHMINQYLVFSDGDVTWTYERTKDEVLEISIALKGKYTISGNEIKFDFEDFEKGEIVTIVTGDEVPDKTLTDLILIEDEKVMAFEKGDGYIKLDGKKINKQVAAEK